MPTIWSIELKFYTICQTSWQSWNTLKPSKQMSCSWQIVWRAWRTYRDQFWPSCWSQMINHVQKILSFCSLSDQFICLNGKTAPAMSRKYWVSACMCKQSSATKLLKHLEKGRKICETPRVQICIFSTVQQLWSVQSLDFLLILHPPLPSLHQHHYILSLVCTRASSLFKLIFSKFSKIFWIVTYFNYFDIPI